MSANNNHENGIFSRYGKWLSGLDRKQRRRLRLAQGALVLAVILLAAALALRAWIRVPDVPVVEPPASSQQGDVSQEDEGLTFDGAQLPEVAKSGRKEGHYTFLVAGRDVFSGATDTMLLFTFDTANKQLNAISLPRDTMINTNSASKRLNAVYGRSRGSSKLPAQERVTNGMTALKQEVSRLTGIYADFYVLVEWDAIGELVDALGGVEYNVPYEMHYDDSEQDLHIHQEKECMLVMLRLIVQLK